jgi:hypothetical protein
MVNVLPVLVDADLCGPAVKNLPWQVNVHSLLCSHRFQATVALPLVPPSQSHALGYYWRGNHGSSLVLGLRMITIQDPTTTHDIYISHTLIIYCLTGSMHRYSQLSID